MGLDHFGVDLPSQSLDWSKTSSAFSPTNESNQNYDHEVKNNTDTQTTIQETNICT